MEDIPLLRNQPSDPTLSFIPTLDFNSWTTLALLSVNELRYTNKNEFSGLHSVFCLLQVAAESLFFNNVLNKDSRIDVNTYLFKIYAWIKG